MATFRVLNPEGYPPKVSARGMAPSLDELEGKKLYLVDVGFAELRQLHGAAARLVRRAPPRDPDRGRPLA